MKNFLNYYLSYVTGLENFVHTILLLKWVLVSRLRKAHQMKKFSKVTAVLGPTNTGKTFFALERMLGHSTGVIGLPLRLLAREIFDKLVIIRGRNVVALITGEERLIPPNPKYWVCTVEAMPSDVGADFVAVDEIQLCGDLERGHVFTDRLMNSRGKRETMFMGSETITRKIQSLIPDATIIKRERLSDLTYKGKSKISRIPGRSAIVSFSVSEVYAIAELIRRQKGGAAVIMGALSPRTRNAQVELYQNGDVDYLVATDAIGMGLNLDIKHVSFAKLAKFDGRKERNLYPNELAQIAGRAGRYKANGTFGVTGEAEGLEKSLSDAIETNRFSPIKFLQWRNSNLNFSSVDFLIKSLEASPDNENFVKAKAGTDLNVLKSLSEKLNITSKLDSMKDVKLLWEVCQIPDFRKLSEFDHSNLLEVVFNFVRNKGVLPDEWLREQVKRLDRVEGDIDTLSKRLAFIRTWTYISYKRSWVNDNLSWQAETRKIENKLSDELHKKLTQRFIDRRTSVLVKGLKQRDSLVAEINQNSEIFVEGQLIGKLVGFCFERDKSASNEESKTLRATAHAVLGPQYQLKSEKLYNSSDEEFSFDESGQIFWRAAAVGELTAGLDILSPKIVPLVDGEAGIEITESITRRLDHFVNRTIEKHFEPLLKMRSDEALVGISKGVAYRIVEALGLISRNEISADIKVLEQQDRALLRKHGLRFGQFTIFHYLMLKPAPTKLRLLLWSLFFNTNYSVPPPAGLVTVPKVDTAPPDYYLRAGYKLVGDRALRVDMLERLADLIRTKDVWNGFEADVDMLSITGLTLEQFAEVLRNLGYVAQKRNRKKSLKSININDQPPIIETTGVDLLNEKKEEVEIVKKVEAEVEVDVEVYYVFKIQKKPKFKSKTDTKNSSENRKGSDFKTTSKFNKNRKSFNKHSSELKIKKEQPIDPDNPFLALLELKNKL